MAENAEPQNQTESQPETKKQSRKSIKEQLEQFKAVGGKVEHLAPATQAEAELATQSFQPVKTQAPERVVEPKDFPCLPSRESDIDCYTLIMTWQDVADYTCYASELYDAPDLPIEQKWQRDLSNKRVMGTDKKTGEHVRGIIDYLSQPVHYFPPLLAVPAMDSGLQVTDSTIHLSEHGLGVLDGQHRRAAIVAALERWPSMSNETVPVVVLNLADVDKRQQIFADVNRTPVKVSKASNLVFDHTDPVSALAKSFVHVERLTYGTDKDGTQVQLTNYPYAALVDCEHLSPKRSANQIASLTNLYNLIEPLFHAVHPYGSRILSDSQVNDTVEAVVLALPNVNAIREGRMTHGQVKAEYIWPFSTCWQALGICLAGALTRRDTEGNLKLQPDQFAEFAGKFVASFGRDGFALDSDRWRQAGRTVVVDGKVGTQKDHVSRMVSILNDYLTV